MALILSFDNVWSRAEIEACLVRSAQLPAQLKVLAWARRFLRKHTPFEREHSDESGNGQDFVATLSALDCITYVYYVLCLATSDGIADFCDRVGRSRFNGEARPSNLIHFTTNSFARMEGAGMVQNVTSSVARGALEERRVTLGIRHDGTRMISAPGGDWNLGEWHSIRYIPSSHVDAAVARVCSGDIVLLITANNAAEHPHLVRHAGFAYRIGAEVYLLHASQTVSLDTNQPVGVSILRRWDATRTRTSTALPLWPLNDYVVENPDLWSGMVVFRCATGLPSVLDSRPRKLVRRHVGTAP